jgi:HD-like signal output (HDOD) protein
MNQESPTTTYNLDDLIRGDVKISSPPMVFSRISKVIDDPYGSLIDIGNILREDQGLTARLLKLANSAFYSFPSNIESTDQAVSIIGTQQIRDLALATSVIELFKGIPKDLINMKNFWCHGVACGVIARILATYRQETNVERFFAAGIMHDIGRLIFYTKIPERSREALLCSKRSGDLLYKVERELIGFNHAAVGGALFKEWKLPVSIIEMVESHHSPLQAKSFPIETAIVHVADIIAHAFQLGSSGELFVPPLHSRAWESIGLRSSILPNLSVQVNRQFHAVIDTIYPDVEK